MVPNPPRSARFLTASICPKAALNLLRSKLILRFFLDQIVTRQTPFTTYRPLLTVFLATPTNSSENPLASELPPIVLLGDRSLSLTPILSPASIWYIPIGKTRKEAIMTELFTEAAILAWVVLVLMVTGETGAGKRWL